MTDAEIMISIRDWFKRIKVKMVLLWIWILLVMFLIAIAIISIFIGDDFIKNPDAVGALFVFVVVVFIIAWPFYMDF